MKRQYIKDLVVKTPVSDIFYIANREVKDRRDGGQFLKLELADKSGSIQAIMWDNVSTMIDIARSGTFARVNGIVGEYNGKMQMTVSLLQPVADRDVKAEDFIVVSKYPIDEMSAELVRFFDEVTDPHLRRLLDTVFGDADIVRQFNAAPGGAKVHHAYIGGLLEHTLFMLRASRSLKTTYAEANYPLLVAGIILHDIGKIDEYKYQLAIDHTDEGRLLGHVVMGYQRIDAVIRKLPGFPPELAKMLLHIILSHHGEMEFGAPKTPKFVEAYLVHMLDHIDAWVAMFRTATKDQSDAKWTDYHSYLETNVFLPGKPPKN
jgi:3'-5' exoribonuclease